MSNQDIEKLAVYDDRIVQQRPKYAVEKGALSLTNSPFNAIAANGSQHTYQIQVPSQKVFVDRAIDWKSTCYCQVTVAVSGTFNAGDIVLTFGRDCALASFPLHSLVNTLTATINDTTTTMNTNDVLREVMRLTDMAKNRQQRTCPTYLDNYQSYNLADGAINSPLNGYGSAVSSEMIPNGAFQNVFFTDSQGNQLVGNGSYQFPLGGNTYNYVNGVPVGTVISGSLATSYPLFFAFTSTEKIVLSPFIFSDVHEDETGLFGVQNIQLVFNMNSPSLTGLNGRVLRSTTNGGRTLSALTYNGSVNNASNSPFANSVVNVQFLTPSLDLDLPPKSIVSYMEFPRYVNSLSFSSVASGARFSVQSQTITLPQIPDLLIIYAKPQSYLATDADYYYPIQKINVNFDNFSGLLSSHTQEELYRMSYNNGLMLDWEQWTGNARVASVGANVALTGGFLVLKPSKDICLQTGQAPSLVGNYTFQFNIDLVNNTGSAITNCNLWVITANSGFFESVNGSSRIIKGVLSEADIIDAQVAENAGVRSELNRAVGGFSFKNMMGNAMSKMPSMQKMKQVYDVAKAVSPFVKPLLPAKAQKALGYVGFGGATGAGSTGAGATGAGKRSLSSRLV